MMRISLSLTFVILLAACSSDSGEVDITSRFNSTWNNTEYLVHNDDGSITYEAAMWGGMAAWLGNNNIPADLSLYEKVVFEFSEPTLVNTQIVVTDEIVSFGISGITSIECSFDGKDVTAVRQIALQTSAPTTLNVQRVYLVPAGPPKYPTTIWQGRCDLGVWDDEITVSSDKFATAKEGDKLEFIYTTENKDKETGEDITYWQLKTTYIDTDYTLEGNETMLNEWGCALVGKNSTNFRVPLTANDAAYLMERGLFVKGYHCIVTQINLLQELEDTDGDSFY